MDLRKFLTVATSVAFAASSVPVFVAPAHAYPPKDKPETKVGKLRPKSKALKPGKVNTLATGVKCVPTNKCLIHVSRFEPPKQFKCVTVKKVAPTLTASVKKEKRCLGMEFEIKLKTSLEDGKDVFTEKVYLFTVSKKMKGGSTKI